MPAKAAKRVRVIHWKPEESRPLLDACGEGGFQVEYESDRFPAIARAVRQSPPDAIVIDLSRLPSHGRESAIAFRNARYSRQIPLIFVGGAKEKVEAVRKILPDATFTSLDGVSFAIVAACRAGTRVPVVPTPVMDRYGTRTVAQKLGILEQMTVVVRDAPRDYAAVVGELPVGAVLVEDSDDVHPVTLWFVHDPRDYRAMLPKMCRIAARTKLWVAWRKGSKNFTGNMVREYAIEVGLVDYKICALGSLWSGMLFAAGKTG